VRRCGGVGGWVRAGEHGSAAAGGAARPAGRGWLRTDLHRAAELGPGGPPGLVELLSCVGPGTPWSLSRSAAGTFAVRGDRDCGDAHRARGAAAVVAGGDRLLHPDRRLLAGVFAALAGYERDLMQERAAAARWPLGPGPAPRPTPRLSADQVRQVRGLRARGEPIADLVGGFGVSGPRSTGRSAMPVTVTWR